MSNEQLSSALLPDKLLRGTAAVFSQGIFDIPHLQQFLESDRLVLRPRAPDGIDYVVGWGHKPTTRRARRFAEHHSLPFIRLEDGFVRSSHPGRRQPTASLVIDPMGIYYDARTRSRLETLIEQGTTDPNLLQRAERVAQRLVRSRISKYNQAPVDSAPVLSRLPPQYILIVDQIANDTSVAVGTSGTSLFEEMVSCAAAENPGVPLVIKTHPAARSPRSGALTSRKARTSFPSVGTTWLTDPVNPHALLKRASKVYVATSQLGFEALLHHKPVVCFGAPFYAGWGLTTDKTPLPRRGISRTLNELVVAVLFLYPRYVHPVSGQRCEIEDVLEHFELQNAQVQRNQGRTYCFGFWWWKRRHARPFLQSPGNEPIFCWNRAQAERLGFDKNSRALAWGQRAPVAVQALCAKHEVPLERMEDGFIRSVGLGSDLTAPWSLVVDRRGLYYDPRQPSDLEILLATHRFSKQELQKAKALRDALLSSGISKYNTSDDSSPPHPFPPETQSHVRILVPGQVEADASVLLGSPKIKSNLELLKSVRAAHPSAHIVFKPHPDVEAGNRPGRVLEKDALCYCDIIVRNRRIADCLDDTDELHTMTSLVGFEALLRGLKVSVYGQPFYAGWGLTHDEFPLARRSKALSLDELVAGVLILYPRYVDPASGYFCSAEHAVDRLIQQRFQPKSIKSKLLNLPLGRPAVRAFHFVQGMVREVAHV